MGKNLIYALVALLCAATLGWLIYDKVNEDEATDLWKLVPPHAVAIAEINDAAQAFPRLKEGRAWQTFSNITALSDFAATYHRLDSTNERKGLINDLLGGQKILISMHVTANNASDLLFFIPLTKDGRRALRELEAEAAPGKVSTRNFHTLRITELEQDNGRLISFLIYQNALVISSSALLIEDVVRVISEENAVDYRESNRQLYELAGLYQKEASIFINYANLPKLASVLSPLPEGAKLPNMANSTFLDISSDAEHLSLTGYTIAGEDDFLQVFAGQTPRVPQCYDLVPNRTAVMRYWGFDDGVALHRKLGDYAATHEKSLISQWDSLEALGGMSAASLYAELGGEVVSLTLEGVDPASPGKMVIIKAKDGSGLASVLQKAVDDYNTHHDSLYQEQFADVTVMELPLNEFPARMFGRDFRGFQQNYYILLGAYMVIAPDIELLKTMVDDVERENVWGKSVERMNFLRQSASESNVGVVANVPRWFEILRSNSTKDWAKFMADNASAFRNIGMSALQFAQDGDRFYTGLTVEIAEGGTQQVLVAGFEEGFSTTLKNEITTPPILVRNHKNRNFEIFVQDKEHRLYFLSGQGSLHWSKEIDGPLVSGIHEVDMLKNGFIQYFFATPETLHILDRTGKYVDGYPVHLPEGVHLRHANMIDYAKSRDYRFVADDGQGDIYLFDGDGDMLEGWSPKKIDYQLAFAPFHIRVRGRDCIIAMQENGVLHMLNRRGEDYAGFPLDLGSPVHSPVFVEEGAAFSSSYISVVTDDGSIIRIDLNGRTVSKSQMYRPSKETRFALAPDVVGRTFAIVRQTSREVAVYDRTQRLLLEETYPSSDHKDVQYYNLGGGKEILVVNDSELGLSHAYLAGEGLLGKRPFKSNGHIALIYSEAKGNYTFYHTAGNTVSTLYAGNGKP